jgi:tetratricopeptide (TPR) repeat protein
MLAAAARGAPSAEEQRLYAEGLAAWNVGDARAAERAWAKGYEVARDPAFLVRMGEAEEKAGAPVEAYETYRRYLREAPDASDRADIEQRIVRLAPAGRPPPPEAKREGADEQPGEFGAAAPASPPTAAPRAGAVDAEAATKPTAEGDSGWNRYNVTAMSTAGASLLLLGTAAFFAAEASSKESDIARLQTARDDTTGTPIPYSSVAGQYESALADGRRDAHDARLALVGAAGAATISAVFFVLDAHFTREASVALAPSARGGGFAAATWRF